MPDQQTIPMTVTTSDPMLAAMLRLIAAQGLPIEAAAIERPAPNEPERLLLSVEMRSLTPGEQYQNYARARNAEISAIEAAALAQQFDHDDAEAIDPHPQLTPEAVEWIPPDSDAVYRPALAAGDDADKRGEIDTQLLIASCLSDNPRLVDVARHLLKPLAGRGYRIDGNREAVMTRLANEFATHPARQLIKAAALLLEGRHECFPDQGEIYKALGRASKPGTSADQPKAA